MILKDTATLQVLFIVSLFCAWNIISAGGKNNTRVGLARSMASAGARAYNEDLGVEPTAGVQGAEPPVGGHGAKLPEADGILVLEHTFVCSPGGSLHSCKL